jgi:hypothetical protein
VGTRSLILLRQARERGARGTNLWEPEEAGGNATTSPLSPREAGISEGGAGGGRKSGTMQTYAKDARDCEAKVGRGDFVSGSADRRDSRRAQRRLGHLR